MNTTRADFPLLIGGEWIEDGERDTIRLPYDGTPAGSIPRSDERMVDRAVTVAAPVGAPAMGALANCERADLLLRIRDQIRDHAEEFAHLVCSETGKPIKEAQVEVERCQQTLTAAAHEARQLPGEVVPMEFSPAGKGRMAMTVREPVGVIAAITPFNIPLNLAL